MNPSTILLDFLKESVNRLKTKSPAFFKVLMAISAALTFAGYVPSILQQWFDFTVNGNVIHWCENIAKVSMGFLVASGLTVQTPVVTQVEEGEEVKKTDDKKMPFTAKKEQKALEKSNVPYSAPEDAEIKNK